jgi:hypothetical protein
MNKRDRAEALRNWVGLNAVVRTADEPTCRELLADELGEKNRKMFVNRLLSRIARVRSQVTRVELDAERAER